MILSDLISLNLLVLNIRNPLALVSTEERKKKNFVVRFIIE